MISKTWILTALKKKSSSQTFPIPAIIKVSDSKLILVFKTCSILLEIKNSLNSIKEYMNWDMIGVYYTAQKIKFPIKDFFSKCDQIHSFLRLWSHLRKKSCMENFIFCAVLQVMTDYSTAETHSEPIQLSTKAATRGVL